MTVQKARTKQLIRRLQRQSVPMDGSVVCMLPQGLRITEGQLYVSYK
jgi:hypothetical protein